MHSCICREKKFWKLNWPKAYTFLGREKCRWWFFVCWIYAEICKHWAHWHQSETVDDQKKSGWFACTRKMYRQVQCRAKEVNSSKHFFLPLLRFVCCCGCVIRWSDAIVTIFAVVNATKFIDSHEMNNQLPKKNNNAHTLEWIDNLQCAPKTKNIVVKIDFHWAFHAY